MKDKLNITIGTTRPFHLFHAARELSALGHNVQVFSYIPNMYASRYNHGTAKHISLFSQFPWTAALALSKISSNSRRQSATERLLELTDKAIAARMKSCDIYIGLSGMAGESLHSARAVGAITICDRGSSHVLHQAQTLAEAHRPNEITSRYISRELNSYSQADYIAIPSLFSKETFLRCGVEEGRMFLNNYGVDLSRFTNHQRRQHNTKRTRLLFVGNWSIRKGCDIFSKLLEELPEHTLTHVGAKGDADFPKTSRFNSLGRVANAELPPIYQDHDIFILPSREDGYGMVILEALASGLLVVASTSSGAPDAKATLKTGSPLAASRITTIASGKPRDYVNEILEMTSASAPIPDIDPELFSWASYGERYSSFLSQLVKDRM